MDALVIGTQKVEKIVGNWAKTNKEYLYCGLPYNETNPFFIPLDFYKDNGFIEQTHKKHTRTIYVNGYDKWKYYLKTTYSWFTNHNEKDFKELVKGSL